MVLGRVGTGKTLLLQSLGQSLCTNGKQAASFGAGTVDADVVLVDDAGSLDAAGLDRLCALRQPFIAAGLPDVEPRILNCRRSIELVRLLPLAPEDVARYLAGRLAATGRARDLFEPDAILAVAGHSGGLFRLVVMLAGSAMFLAEQEDAPHVTRRHADEAAAMREVLQEEDASPPAQVMPVDHGDEEVPTPRSTTSKKIPPPGRHSFRVAPFAGALAGLMGLGLVTVAVAWMVSYKPHIPPEPVAGGAPAEANAPQPLPPHPAPQLAQVPAPAPPQTQPSAPAPSPQPDSVPVRSPEDASPLPPGPPGKTVVTFRGPIMNETMGQSGQLSLTIRSDAATGSVAAHFHAHAGLIGSGELTGMLGPDGRLDLSGQLMMGRNPYNCSLSGTLRGGTLTGSATFVRAGGRGSARSTFTLSRL
jgi:hypothetical protein